MVGAADLAARRRASPPEASPEAGRIRLEQIGSAPVEYTPIESNLVGVGGRIGDGAE